MKQFTLAIFCMVTLTSFSCMAQTHNGYEYVDLGLPSGTLWATCNVGATTPEGYGDYFAWGETEPKETYDWDNYKWWTCTIAEGAEMPDSMYILKYNYDENKGFVDNKYTLDSIDDAASVHWGGSWRTPNWDEIKELYSTCTLVWTQVNSINGCMITGPNGKTIFLPATGMKHNNQMPPTPFTFGSYWGNEINEPAGVDGLYFTQEDLCNRYHSYPFRLSGCSVRPVCKNVSPEIEDEALVSFEAGGIYYNSLGGDSVEVTKRETLYEGNIVIPATIQYKTKTYRVTSISDYAFCECEELLSVDLPNSIKHVGLHAFLGCPKLTTPIYNDYLFTRLPQTYKGAYTIPEGIKVITSSAFLMCEELTSVSVPNSVNKIGEMAFQYCGKLESVNIPDGVDTIGRYTFGANMSLTTVNIPNSVTYIAHQAFYLCSSLESITIPSSVVQMEWGVFSGCSSLVDITVKAAVPAVIEEDCFFDVPNTMVITVPCGAKSAYQSANGWKEWTNISDGFVFELSAISSDETKGLAVILQDPTCEQDAIIQAIPKSGYKFMSWNDGNTENPRTVEATEDIQYVANFAEGTSALENTAANQKISVHKLLENGTIYILRNGEKYTVDGIRVM